MRESMDEENLIINSLLNRLERIERDMQIIKKEHSEEIVKILHDSKKIDDQKEKSHAKDISEIEGELNERLTRIEESIKQSHTQHVEEKKNLLAEFESQKISNQQMIEEGLKLLQKLEFLEMKIGKK